MDKNDILPFIITLRYLISSTLSSAIPLIE
jgi:hypothetical protein